MMNHNYSYRGHSQLSAVGKARTLAQYVPQSQKSMSGLSNAQKMNNARLSTYQQASVQLGELIANSIGLHNTQEIQPDGSVINYQHPKGTSS